MAAPQESALTDISRLGEFGLIDRITRGFKPQQARTLTPLGDDAAVLDAGNGRVQVVTTDFLLEGVHFDLAYVPLQHLGYKAVAVNLSDVAAMNARPYGITVSIALSNRFPVEAVDELYAGIKLACEKYGADLLGGDTTSSRQGLVISVTALGEVEQQRLTYRKGAQPTDLICVTGDVGAAYGGLLVLDREKSVFQDQPDMQPDLTDYDYLIGRQLKPEPRLDIVQLFEQLGLQPTSMIDVSDGIGSELHHLCKQSQKGALIYASKLPFDPQTMKVAEEFKLSPTVFGMNGGEDYELLFTLPLADFDRIKSRSEFTIIGHMTEDPNLVQIVLEDGQVAEVEAQGWQHFNPTTGRFEPAPAPPEEEA